MDEQDPTEIFSVDQNIDANPVIVHPGRQDPDEVLAVIPPVDLIKNNNQENLHVDEQDSDRIPPVELRKNNNLGNLRMDETHREILMGIILLFLIIDTIVIFSMASGAYLQNPSPTLVTSPVETTAPVPMVNPTPPLVASTTPPPVKTAVPTPTPVPARAGYANIYYLKDKTLDTTAISPILFNLVKPPLIIEFDVTAMNITDIKPDDYKMGSTEYHELHTIIRPYENAAFAIKVTDNDSGRVAAEDGYGKEYGLQSPKSIEVKERGNYTISLSGMYVNVSLSMEAPKERNFPEVSN
jgi:hypothetical protein